MYLEIYFGAAEFQNIFKIHKWECSIYTKKKLYICLQTTKRILHIQNRPKVFRWASNYVLTLETDEGCPAFLPLLSYLHR